MIVPQSAGDTDTVSGNSAAAASLAMLLGAGINARSDAVATGWSKDAAGMVWLRSLAPAKEVLAGGPYAPAGPCSFQKVVNSQN